MEAAIGFAVVLSLYFLPTIVAVVRGHHNPGPLVIVNLLLGWTLIGWVAALAMAFSRPPVAVPLEPDPEPEPDPPPSLDAHQRAILSVLERVGQADRSVIVSEANLSDEEYATAMGDLLYRGQVEKAGTGFRLPAGHVPMPEQPDPQPSAPSPPPPPEAGTSSAEVSDRLRLLKRLHADGLLTEDEYAAKRRAVLDEL